MWCGTNDLAAGHTPAQAYAALTSYVASAHAAGFTVIVATMLSRDNPAGLDAARAEFNADIEANTAGANAVVVFDSTPLGRNGGASNGLYFNNDFIHPNNVGEYNYIVPAMQAVLP